MLQQGIQFHCSQTIKRLEHRNQPTPLNQELFSTPVFPALAQPRFQGLFPQVLLLREKSWEPDWLLPCPNHLGIGILHHYRIIT